jgi:hypothetical protein
MKRLVQDRTVCAVLGLALGSLTLALLCWALSSPPRASALRLPESPLDESPPTSPASGPNPHCGVAGARPIHLQALSLSVGSPEPGGYVWGYLVAGNGVQMVNPCKRYAEDPPYWTCYDETTEAIWNGNAVTFTNWITQHPGMVWLIGNEPDLSEQDGLTETQYARMYHYYHGLIKAADPTAQIATAGFSHKSPPDTYPEQVLTAYEELYSETMPVDIWNFHYYNESNYNAASVIEPINSRINWVRTTRDGAYADTPIWLTEWGKLNGWKDLESRFNHIPDDEQDPRLASLMLSSRSKITSYFGIIPSY